MGELGPFSYPYGRETYDQSGAIVMHFAKKVMRQRERELGHVPVRRLSEYLHCYAIVSTSGEVTTVGKRFKRLNR